jgi:hypothetical protein
MKPFSTAKPQKTSLRAALSYLEFCAKGKEYIKLASQKTRKAKISALKLLCSKLWMWYKILSRGGDENSNGS